MMNTKQRAPTTIFSGMIYGLNTKGKTFMGFV